MVTFCSPKKSLAWLVELPVLDLSGNHHSPNALYIINSQNFWSC